MSDNLLIFDKVKTPPKEALKKIEGGRLRGMTDINPMWRIKALTEQFGPCGYGWKYVITKQWIEEGSDGVKAAFTNIDLFIKHNGEWSEAIPGTGGSSFVANEKNRLYTSDECFKMSLTDAISVACKALGFAADIYWGLKETKYENQEVIDTSTFATIKRIKELYAKKADELGGNTFLNKQLGVSDKQAKTMFDFMNQLIKFEKALEQI